MLSYVKAAGAWLAGLARRSLENPTRPLDPWAEATGDGVDGGMRSLSGMKVSRDKALTLPAIWRGVNLVSRTTAKLPLYAYLHVGPGKQIDFAHDASRLFRRPNEMMTPFIWKQLVINHVMMEGNHYSYVFRRADGKPLELLPLDPNKTYPVIADRKLYYVHELKSGEPRRLDPADVFHVKGLGFDGLVGYSVIAKIKEAAGLGLAAQGFGSVFFRNSARPNVVIQVPGRLSPEARKNLRESWERIHSGIDNAHRTAVLEEGSQAKEMSVNARDSQLIESRQFTLIDVANFLFLPPHKLGANVNVSYASLEQENQAYLDDSIDPWLVAIEEEAGSKLLTEKERDEGTHAIAFDRFPLVRADMQQRGAFYAQAITAGWMSPDEARGRENLNPMPDGLGDVYFRPLNLAVAGEPPPEPTPAPTPSPESGGADAGPKRALLADVLRRMTKRLGVHARKAAKEPATFLRWLDTFAADHRGTIAEAVEPVALVIGRGKPGELADLLVAEVRESLLQQSGECTAARLPQCVDAWMTRLESNPESLATFKAVYPES